MAISSRAAAWAHFIPRRIDVRVLGAIGCIAFLLAGISLAFVQRFLVGNMAPDFTLTDQNGKPWTLSRERGREAVALSFGYTHCPDVCPTTLAHLTQARRMLGARGANLRIVFVTVDATRDTSAVLKRYVALFDSTVVGLTGDARSTGPVYGAYHVWHQTLPATETGAGYLVSHSSAIYLIDRSGRLVGLADWSDLPEKLETRLREILT